MEYTKFDNQKLFEYVYDIVVFGSGGDGDAIIQFKSQDLEAVVKEFEQFLQNKDSRTHWNITCHDERNLFFFNHHHEAIGFCNSKYEFDNKSYEVVVRTW